MLSLGLQHAYVFHPYGGGGRGRRREEERASKFSPPREPKDRMEMDLKCVSAALTTN